MAYKPRAYVAFTTTVNSGSEIELESYYNSTKSGDNKVSDSGVSGTVSFYGVTFFHDQNVKVKYNAHEPHNDYVEFKKTTSTFDRNSIGNCKAVVFKNESGSTLNLTVYAQLNKSNLVVN